MRWSRRCGPAADVRGVVGSARRRWADPFRSMPNSTHSPTGCAAVSRPGSKRCWTACGSVWTTVSASGRSTCRWPRPPRPGTASAHWVRSTGYAAGRLPRRSVRRPGAAGTLAAVTGKVQSVNEFREDPRRIRPLLTDRVDVMVAGGVCASLSASGSTAMTALMRAAAAERDCLGVRPTVDTALTNLALCSPCTSAGPTRPARFFVPGSRRRRPRPCAARRILLGWAAMASGDLDRAEAVADRHCGEIPCQTISRYPRCGSAIARVVVTAAMRGRARSGDGGARRVPRRPARADVRRELWVGRGRRAGSRTGVRGLPCACELVDALGPAAQWSSLFHWYGVHAAIASCTPAARWYRTPGAGCRRPVLRLRRRAGPGRKVWVQVLGGDVDADDVDAAARELDAHAPHGMPPSSPPRPRCAHRTPGGWHDVAARAVPTHPPHPRGPGPNRMNRPAGHA